MVPAFIGVGGAVAILPGIIVAVTMAFAEPRAGGNPLLSALSLLGLGAAAVLGSFLILGIVIPWLALLAAVPIVGLGVAMAFGVDGVFVLARHLRSRRAVRA